MTVRCSIIIGQFGQWPAGDIIDYLVTIALLDSDTSTEVIHNLNILDPIGGVSMIPGVLTQDPTFLSTGRFDRLGEVWVLNQAFKTT
jgi:hypothetical protein